MATPLCHANLVHLLDDNFLNDRNYLQWAQFIRRVLKIIGRPNHIEGVVTSRDNSNFQIWDNDDLQIITWLCGSMTAEISKNYMFYSSAHEIWKDLANTIPCDRTSLHVELESKNFGAKQVSLSVAEYYGVLKGS